MAKRTFLKFSKGFTLVELIVVITIVTVLAVSLTTIFTDTTKGYLQAEQRIDMASNTRVTLDKLSRQIREAMPNSIRVNVSQTCVEYVPIVAATQYTSLPTTAPSTSLTVVEADAETRVSGLDATSSYVMVIPLNSSEVYNVNSGHFAQITSFAKLGSNLTEVSISNTRFSRQSPQRRVFFVTQPASVCLVGSELHLYENYGFQVTQPAPTAMGTPQILADNLSLVDRNGTAIPVFTYDAGTLSRGGILQTVLIVAGRDESIRVEHEIHVRNFP